MNASRTSGLYWFHVLGLWTLGVAHPLFDLLARNPEFFVAHRSGPAEIILMVAGLVLVVPAILVGAIWLAGLAGRKAHAVALATVMAGLVGLLAMQVVKQTGVQTWLVAVPIAAAAGLALAVAYHSLAPLRTFASVLSFAVVVVPVMFVYRPAIRRAVFPPPAQVSSEASRTVESAASTGHLASIVMVVFDEVPLVSLLDASRRIDPEAYRNLAALASDGILYRNATSINDYTRWSLPAILSGTFPRPDAAPAAADHPNTLFTLVERTHRLRVFEPLTRLCPDRLCGPPTEPVATRMRQLGNDLWIIYLHVLLTDDLRADLPSLTGDWANFGEAGSARRRRRAESRRLREQARRAGKRRVETAREFIAGITNADDRPAFHFLHTMLPHTPHLRLPSGQTNGTVATARALALPRAIPGKYRDEWTADDWVVQQHYQRHLLQLGFVDKIIGELVARLRATGLYDQTLILVTSDHGTAFRPGSPRRDYTDETAAEIMRVPLIIKFPKNVALPAGHADDVAGQRVTDRNVETVDIAPTVADAVGLELPWKADGMSLLDDTVPERSSKVIFYDSARQTKSFDRRGPDVGPALARKLEVFGSSGNPYRVPRPPRFADVVGQPVSSLRVAEGGADVEVDFLSEFSNMNVRADSVAFDVAGRLRSRPPDRTPVHVAVAVNGVVRAVTRTWRSEPDSWLATPPLDTWRNGHNTLEVFRIDTDARGRLFRRCTVRQGRAD